MVSEYETLDISSVYQCIDAKLSSLNKAVPVLRQVSCAVDRLNQQNSN